MIKSSRRATHLTESDRRACGAKCPQINTMFTLITQIHSIRGVRNEQYAFDATNITMSDRYRASTCVGRPFHHAVILCINNVEIQLIINNNTGRFIQPVECISATTRTGDNNSLIRVRRKSYYWCQLMSADIHESILVERQIFRVWQRGGAWTCAGASNCDTSGGVRSPALNAIVVMIADIHRVVGIDVNTGGLVK